MTSSIEHAVREWLINHHITNQHVVVGVSGGVDSITLLHILHHLRSELHLQLTVAHVDHGLRGIHSDADRQYVHSLCASLEIQCRSTVVDTSSLTLHSGKGLEAIARNARYEFFEEVAAQVNARFVLTAHTLNDNVETFIMNAARGSGLSGLAGIPPIRSINDCLQVARPLLTITRDEVVCYAQVKGLSWRNDDTNDTLLYTRNRVRHLVVPAIIEALGHNALRGIGTTLSHALSAREGISQLLARNAALVHRSNDGTIQIPMTVFNSLPLQLRGELLHAIDPDSTIEDIRRLLQLHEAEVGTEASLSGERVAFREHRAIVITRADSPSLPEPVQVVAPTTVTRGAHTLTLSVVAGPVELSRSETCVFFDADAIAGHLTWRVWRDGDRIQPFGLGGGSMLVSDVLTNARVNHSQRRLVHVLTDEQGILWVSGYRRCNRALVDSHTKQVLIANLTNTIIEALT